MKNDLKAAAEDLYQTLQDVGGKMRIRTAKVAVKELMGTVRIGSATLETVIMHGAVAGYFHVEGDRLVVGRSNPLPESDPDDLDGSGPDDPNYVDVAGTDTGPTAPAEPPATPEGFVLMKDYLQHCYTNANTKDIGPSNQKYAGMALKRALTWLEETGSNLVAPAWADAAVQKVEDILLQSGMAGSTARRYSTSLLQYFVQEEARSGRV